MKEISIVYNNVVLRLCERDEVDQSVIAEIFKVREYRRAEEIIKNANHSIIDVGAHAGFFTLYARALNPTVTIIAVEPESDNISLFKKHCLKNGIKNIVLVEGVVTGDSGKRQLALSADSHNHAVVGLDNNAPQNTIQVRSYTLAEIISKSSDEKISLLKLDIEGGEYEIFDSMSDVDFVRIEAIIMEYHTKDGYTYGVIEQTLREHGFGVEIFPSHFDKSMGFLWARNKRI